MARLWRIRVRSWPFASVRRVADLPFLFAIVRQFTLGVIPKLRTRVRFSSPALYRHTRSAPNNRWDESDSASSSAQNSYKSTWSDFRQRR